MKNLLFAMALAVALCGCGAEDDEYSNADCSWEMTKIEEQEGRPEEVNKYDASDYHSWDYWYWSDGIVYTFTWGSIVDGCEVTTYQF